MLITSIQQQKKNKGRYSVFMDGEFKFGISGEDVLFFKLKEGIEIDQHRYDYLLENVILAEAKYKAMNFLGYKARTRKEMKDKLNTYEYPETVIEDVIGVLERYGYIDDYDYAKKYVSERIAYKNDGLYKLKYNLKGKGVSSIIIETVIEEMDYDPISSILKILDKKLIPNDYDEKEKNKVYNHIVRKGFSYEDIAEGFRKFDEGYEI